MGITHPKTSGSVPPKITGSDWDAAHVLTPGPYSHVGSVTTTGASPFTFTKPGGTQDGDLIILAGMFTNSIPDVAGPSGSGWQTLVRFDTSSNEFQVIYYKWASSEPASWTLTHSVGTDCAGAVSVFRGIDTYHGFDYNQDVRLTPPIGGKPDGIVVCVWLTTTAGSPQIAIPSSLTQSAYVQAVSTNNPQVLIGYGPTYWDGPVFQHAWSGAAAATGYTMAAAVSFYTA